MKTYKFAADHVCDVGEVLKVKRIGLSVHCSVEISFTGIYECEVVFYSTLSLRKLRKMLLKMGQFKIVSTLNKESDYTGEPYYLSFNKCDESEEEEK